MVDPVSSTGGLSAPSTTAATTTASARVSGTTANVPARSVFTDDLAKATERLQPVAHRGYSKVMSGAREGMYVNETANARHGQAFQLEYHGGRRWHVYGEGADRVVIAFPKQAAAAAAEPTEKAPATGTATDVSKSATSATSTTSAASTTAATKVTAAADRTGGASAPAG